MKQEPIDIETQIATLNLLDVQGIDWERVQRTAYLIHQHFRYDYPGPVRELQQRLLIVPPDVYGDQKCIMHRLDVSAHVAETTGEVDEFGNAVIMLSIPLIERSIDFEAWRNRYPYDGCPGARAGARGVSGLCPSHAGALPALRTACALCLWSPAGRGRHTCLGRDPGSRS
ncbi:MAG: hypothetical protein E6I97_24265 [Chloroflexi bacterium]|nr:MAG: hypothetical protein E6I97_24265 [Chloroflexota bacterium]